MDKKNFDQISAHFHKTIQNLDIYHPKIVIAFSGIPGSGKTFIAKQLENKYKAVRIQNDKIREAVDKVFQNISNEEAEKFKDSYLMSVLDELKNKRNGLIILDSSMDRRYPKIIKWCKENNFKLIVIKLDITKEIAVKRLKEREGTNAKNYLKNLDRWFLDFKKFNRNYKADITIDSNKDTVGRELESKLKPLFTIIEETLRSFIL